MLSLQHGHVTSIEERHEGLTRLEVDGSPCVAYPRVTGPVAIGDEVIVNVQARKLALGSGGFDVLYVNLTRGIDLAEENGAHVMKFPYTPQQFAAHHGEEAAALPDSLEAMPVVACSLHSQLAPVCAALAGVRVAYVQVPGGALPVALSDTVRALRERGLLHVTISAGECFGGDIEAVNVYSALALARSVADAAVCAVGPGIVGTATRFGHGGMSAAEALTAAAALGAMPALALRMSSGDARGRHQGVSHHAKTILSVADARVVVPWPSGCPFDRLSREGVVEVDVADWREACAGLPLDHMGRGADEDPWFFAASFAAGRLARRGLGQ